MTRRQKVSVALWLLAGVPLAVGAVAGLALSYSNVVRVVAPIVGDESLARIFPLTWDVILAGAALAYLATAYMGRARQMWRVISQAGAVGTVLVNATAAHDWPSLVVHLSGPIAWAVLVEAAASQLRGAGTSAPPAAGESVPVRLWVTAPVESARTWLRMARRVQGEQAAARLEVGAYNAAVQALRLTLPERRHRPTRAILHRQLRAGSLPPRAVLAACGWLDPHQGGNADTDPAQRILRAALGAALGPAGDQAPAADPVDDQGDRGDRGDRVVSVMVGSGPDARPIPEPVPAPTQPQGATPAGRHHVGDAVHIPAPAQPQNLPQKPAQTAVQEAGQPVREPAVAARQERPGALTVATVDAVPAGAADGNDELLTAARVVAEQAGARGERLTRAVLLAGLREAGHPCGNTRAGLLLAQLRPAETA